MTPEELEQLIAATFGETPAAVTPLTFGHSSVSYRVALATRAVILRTNMNPAVFTGTAHNLAVLRQLGLPVSRLITSDLTQTLYPAAYLILEEIPGHDLRFELGRMSRPQKERLAEQLAGFRRTVATLPQGSGFGYAPIGEAAPFPTWRELVLSESRKHLLPRLEPPLAAWHTRIFALAETFAPYLERVSPTCFLDDLTTKNVIVQAGALQGLIDFDVVCYGDPLWTLGLTAAAIVLDVGAEHLDYVAALCHAYGLTAEQRRVVSWYASLFALTFLGRANPEETKRLLPALEGWIEPLEG